MSIGGPYEVLPSHGVPSPLASTTAGALTPIVELSVAMMTSQQASSVAFPASRAQGDQAARPRPGRAGALTGSQRPLIT